MTRYGDRDRLHGSMHSNVYTHIDTHKRQTHIHTLAYLLAIVRINVKLFKTAGENAIIR